MEWVRSLIHLRRSSVSLNDGDTGHVNVQFDEEKRWLVMIRGSVRVLVNLGIETVELQNPDGLPVRLSSRTGIAVTPAGVTLPPNSLVVLSR